MDIERKLLKEIEGLESELLFAKKILKDETLSKMANRMFRKTID